MRLPAPRPVECDGAGRNHNGVPVLPFAAPLRTAAGWSGEGVRRPQRHFI